MGNGTDEKEDKVDLTRITRRLMEIFQIQHSLTSEELEERRELQERSGTFLALGRALTTEENREQEKTNARLARLSAILSEGRELSEKCDAELLELTAILLELRERPARQAEARKSGEDPPVPELVSLAESMAANKGVFNERGDAWKWRQN